MLKSLFFSLQLLSTKYRSDANSLFPIHSVFSTVTECKDDMKDGIKGNKKNKPRLKKKKKNP